MVDDDSFRLCSYGDLKVGSLAHYGMAWNWCCWKALRHCTGDGSGWLVVELMM